MMPELNAAAKERPLMRSILGEPEDIYDAMIDEKIRRRAYRYWEERGRPFGSPDHDWFRAVEEVKRDQTQPLRRRAMPGELQ